MKRYRLLTAILFAAAGVLLPALAEACPGCKEALFDPGQLSQKLATARGYAASIGVLLAVPFILVATVAGLVIHGTRRNKQSS